MLFSLVESVVVPHAEKTAGAEPFVVIGDLGKRWRETVDVEAAFALVAE